MDIFKTIAKSNKMKKPLVLLEHIEGGVYFVYYGKAMVVNTIDKEDAIYLFELTRDGYNLGFSTLDEDERDN